MEHNALSQRIVFFGTPEFAVPALEALVGADYDVAAVVTQPDKPVGRGLKMEAPAVKKKAEELGLKVLQPATLRNVEALPPTLRRQGLADIGIAVAYGKIIPKTVLDLFPRGILNIHPSLLPKYRGPSPIQAAILNGDAETGVAIMLLDEQLDHGPILTQSPPLRLRGGGEGLQQPTGSELAKFLAQKGAELLVETLPKYLAGEITPLPQDHAKATFTKLLTREDGHIDWNKPAEYIERMVRAYDLWPGTWSLWNQKRIKVLKVSVHNPATGHASNSTPGYVFAPNHPLIPSLKRRGNRTLSPPVSLREISRRETRGGDSGGMGEQIAVGCNPGSIILELLQLEGKKTMSGAEFMRGHPAVVGAYLLITSRD